MTNSLILDGIKRLPVTCEVSCHFPVKVSCRLYYDVKSIQMITEDIYIFSNLHFIYICKSEYFWLGFKNDSCT